MKTPLGLGAQAWMILHHFFLMMGITLLGIGILCATLLLLSMRQKNMLQPGLSETLFEGDDTQSMGVLKKQILLLIGSIITFIGGSGLTLVILKLEHPTVGIMILRVVSEGVAVLLSLLLVLLGYRCLVHGYMGSASARVSQLSQANREKRIQRSLMFCIALNLAFVLISSVLQAL